MHIVIGNVSFEIAVDTPAQIAALRDWLNEHEEDLLTGDQKVSDLVEELAWCRSDRNDLRKLLTEEANDRIGISRQAYKLLAALCDALGIQGKYGLQNLVWCENKKPTEILLAAWKLAQVLEWRDCPG